jgi:hypothetical protein
MKISAKTIFNKLSDYIRRLTKPDVIAAVIVTATVIGVTINTTSVIMQNYQLEREVRVMEQKVIVAEIELETQKSKNQYYGTDYFLDIAARKQLSRGSPGEKLIIVPKSIALAQLPAGYKKVSATTTGDIGSLPNYRKWQLFITGDLN